MDLYGKIKVNGAIGVWVGCSSPQRMPLDTSIPQSLWCVASVMPDLQLLLSCKALPLAWY